MQQARASTKPDPYALLKVGNKTHQTKVLMRTIHPVWEEGFTFLVANPDNDSLFINIVDQKTGNEIGQLIYKLKNLANKANLVISKEPYTLLKAGPESKVVMSMHLRVSLRRYTYFRVIFAKRRFTIIFLTCCMTQVILTLLVLLILFWFLPSY